MSKSFGARTAMVWAGLPSSQRNRVGAANQTCPVAVNGWASDFSARVCVKSADQVWILVWASSQRVKSGPISTATAESFAPRTNNRNNRIKRLFISHLVYSEPEKDFSTVK